jgi:riboflavin-specific deaminase-like protein
MSFEPILTSLDECYHKRHSSSSSRPFTTLTYAQSLDGSIARGSGTEPLLLSSEQSMLMTHRLRAWHDGIMVGIGTVLSDDPSLTTRKCPGESPRPIVLDNNLRCPPSCKLITLRDGKPPAIIVCSSKIPKLDEKEELARIQRRAELEKSGAVIVEAANLEEALMILKERFKLERIMIEGGARIIRSTLEQTQLVDVLLLTIAPVFVGGLVPTFPWRETLKNPKVKVKSTAMVDGDICLLAEFDEDMKTE